MNAGPRRRAHGSTIRMISQSKGTNCLRSSLIGFHATEQKTRHSQRLWLCTNRLAQICKLPLTLVDSSRLQKNVCPDLSIALCRSLCSPEKKQNPSRLLLHSLRDALRQKSDTRSPAGPRCHVKVAQLGSSVANGTDTDLKSKYCSPFEQRGIWSSTQVLSCPFYFRPSIGLKMS
jgi:hypothetical protein